MYYYDDNSFLLIPGFPSITPAPNNGKTHPRLTLASDFFSQEPRREQGDWVVSELAFLSPSRLSLTHQKTEPAH